MSFVDFGLDLMLVTLVGLVVGCAALEILQHVRDFLIVYYVYVKTIVKKKLDKRNHITNYMMR